MFLGCWYRHRAEYEASYHQQAAEAVLAVMTSVMKDDTELFKQFMDNADFKRWMTDTVFRLASDRTIAQ